MGTMPEESMVEYRCNRCHKLLFRTKMWTGVVQIKCKKCKELRQFEWNNGKEISDNPKVAGGKIVIVASPTAVSSL